MQEFITVHRDCIQGVLHGFDRMIFRGTLRSISYPDGLGRYMSSQQIRFKDFDAWAQRCTRRLNDHLEGLAKAAGRPCEYLASAAASKEERALEIARRDQIKEGMVCVLSCVEPCISATLYRNRLQRRIELAFTSRKCKFYYLYLIDPDFGWMHIRIQSWIPFDVQVYVNGRTYLKGQLDKAAIGYVQHDNCFNHIDDVAGAQALLDQLLGVHWPTVLRRLLAAFWPRPQAGLLPEGPERYYWTIRQSELATDVMFKDAASLASVYPRLCRHAIEGLACQDILRFMGKSPSRFGGQVTGSYQRLVQGLRVKHSHGGNTIKMYDKAGSILRVETTINFPGQFRVFRGPLSNPRRDVKWRALGKSVADIARRAAVSRAANERYLAALAVVGSEQPAASVLDPVCRSVQSDGQRFRGLRPVGPDDGALFAAVMDGRHLIDGLTNGSLQAALFSKPPPDEHDKRRRSNQVGRRLRLLRRHGLLKKIGKRRLYRVTPKGQQVMSLSLAIRQCHSLLSKAG